MVTVDPTPVPVVAMGGPVSNTFQQTGIQENSVTFKGGTGQNTFVPVPTGNHNVAVVTSPAMSNTLNLSNDVLPTTVIDKTTGLPKQIGAYFDLNNSQQQDLYQSQLENPDIGSLVDPSELTTNSKDSLSLQGPAPMVILGNGANLYTASTSYSTASGNTVVPGTTVVALGTDNTIYAGTGVTVQSSVGGNTVIQNYNPTQANAFLVSTDQSTTAAQALTQALAGSAATVNAALGGVGTGPLNTLLGGIGTGPLNTLLGGITGTTLNGLLGGVTSTTLNGLLGGLGTGPLNNLLGGVTATTLNTLLGGTTSTTLNALLGGIGTGTLNGLLGGVGTGTLKTLLGGLNPGTLDTLLGGLTNTTLNGLLGGVGSGSLNTLLGGLTNTGTLINLLGGVGTHPLNGLLGG